MLPWILAGWLAACGADAGTTHYALSRGAREAVFPTQNPWAVDAFITGEGVIGAAGTTALWKSKHKKLAVGLMIAATAIHGYAAIHNAQVAHRLGQ